MYIYYVGVMGTTIYLLLSWHINAAICETKYNTKLLYYTELFPF